MSHANESAWLICKTGNADYNSICEIRQVVIQCNYFVIYGNDSVQWCWHKEHSSPVVAIEFSVGGSEGMVHQHRRNRAPGS